KAAAADGRLRTFDTDAQRELIPVLRNAESVRTLPSPADDVLRIDLQGKRFLPVFDSFLAFGHHAPHLATRKIEPALKLDGRAQLPLAEHVAVALPVVGGDARSEEVALVVAAHLCIADFRVDEQSQPRLAGGEVVLAHLRQSRTRIGNTRKRGVDVGA